MQSRDSADKRLEGLVGIAEHHGFGVAQTVQSQGIAASRPGSSCSRYLSGSDWKAVAVFSRP